MNIFGRSKINSNKKNEAKSTCFNRLENMKNIGFYPKTILDCGASVGYWAWQAYKMFPKTKIVSIEPIPTVFKELEKMLSKMKNNPIGINAAVGMEEGTANLNIWDNEETKMSGSSLKSHVQGEPRKKIEVKVNKIDNLCNEYQISPDLIKLDLQGAELDALKGAEKTLCNTELVITEFGVLEAYIDRTTPQELINFFYDRGFILYDIVDLLYRPYDNTLTGGDFFFLNKTSTLRDYKGFK